MYNSYFGFRQAPFNIAPDPNFLYTNPIYQEALATLAYGIQAKKGFLVLMAEAGTGKTTLLRQLMRNLHATVHTAFIFYTQVTFPELLRLILHDLGLFFKGKNQLMMLQELNNYLVQQLEKGHTVALVIDDGQNLSDEALEGLLLLSNLKTTKENLLQIILAGQLELDARLNRVVSTQRKQQVAVRCRLDSLGDKEIGNYIAHRLKVAGHNGPEIFSEEAIEEIWACSHGNPRLINIISDNALVLAHATDKHSVSRAVIDEVAYNLRLKRELKLVKPHTMQVEHPRGRPLPQRMDSNHRWKSKGKAGPTTAPLKRDGCQPSSLPRAVPPDFIGRMSRALAEAMGPMGPVVIKHEISMLGKSVENFPSETLAELVELLSRKILSSRMKNEFKSTMLAEINELEGRRAALHTW
jgi:general secretion pathway protein A